MSADEDPEQEESKPKNVENESSEDTEIHTKKDQNIKDEEDTTEKTNSEKKATFNDKPKIEEKEVITKQRSNLDVEKKHNIGIDESNLDTNERHTASLSFDDENHLSKPKDSAEAVETVILKTDILNTNESVSDSTELDDNQADEPLIIDENVNDDNAKNDEPTITQKTDGILEDSGLQLDETMEKSENNALTGALDNTNIGPLEKNMDKEEFKMPDNFDLPEDYFISIKPNRSSRLPSVEASSKAITPSFIENDKKNSHLVSDFDKNAKDHDMQEKEQSKIATKVSRNLFSSPESLDHVSKFNRYYH